MERIIAQFPWEYMVADPWFFRSGYIKEFIWRYIVKCNNNDKIKRRLKNVALDYLDKRMQREFWYMCRAITKIADEEFWRDVKEKMQSKDILISERSKYLFSYSLGNQNGEKTRKSVHDKVLSVRYR